MKNYFSRFGEIEKLYRIIDPNTSKKKNFGFIEFKSKKSVDVAMTENHHWIQGSLVTVNRYGRNKPKNKKKSTKMNTETVSSNSLVRNSKQLKSSFQDHKLLKKGSTKGWRHKENFWENDLTKKKGKKKLEEKDEFERKNLGGLGKYFLPHNRFRIESCTSVVPVGPKQGQKRKIPIPEDSLSQDLYSKMEPKAKPSEPQIEHDKLQDEEDEETPNQDSPQNENADLMDHLQIHSKEDQRDRAMGIITMSRMKHYEEEYYLTTGLSFQNFYRMNFGRGTPEHWGC